MVSCIFGSETLTMTQRCHHLFIWSLLGIQSSSFAFHPPSLRTRRIVSKGPWSGDSRQQHQRSDIVVSRASSDGGGGPPYTSSEEQEKIAKLGISLLIDFVGFASFALPGVGEAGDLAWAPISAGLIQCEPSSSSSVPLAIVRRSI